MAHSVYTVASLVGFVVLYVAVAAVLSVPLRRSKVAHFLAATMVGLAFLVWMILPEEKRLVFLPYLMITLLVTLFFLTALLMIVAQGWLALQGLRFNDGNDGNDGFLKKSGTILLIAAALSFLIWAIVTFVIFGAFLGGHPYLGKVVGDAYYFGQHGNYTRVTPATWWISFWIVTALHIIPPVCLVSGLVLIGLSRHREKSKSGDTKSCPGPASRDNRSEGEVNAEERRRNPVR